MTTGEKLVIMSTLDTGTAMEHFMNIRWDDITNKPPPSKPPECESIGGGGGIENIVLDGMKPIEIDYSLDMEEIELEDIDLE